MSAGKHARDRLLERVGVELPQASWAQIVENAKAGVYDELPGKAAPDGATRAFEVPMGASERDMVYVPMVINVDQSFVVTVLDPRPA